MRNLFLLLLVCAGALHAQDYSDAPASYGLMFSWSAGQTCWLGQGASSDTSNPITPSWTGDSDDGVVGTPLWDSWSSQNSLSVMVNGNGAPGVTPTMVFLVAFVDANDDGVFSANETYMYSPFQVPVGQLYTFTGIHIHATQDFSRNGANRVGVRIAVQDTIGGPAATSPGGNFFMGEVEDWLVDVSPASLRVATETLPLANESASYSATVAAVNGTTPFQWSATGALPAGISAAQVGNDFVLSGVPAAATGPADYPIAIQVSDSVGATSNRTLVLRVDPAPYALPFQDDFSTDKGWHYQHLWARAPVTGVAGNAVHGNFHGQFPTEPAQDFTSSNADNMALMDSPGATYEHGMAHESWVESPRMDCSQETSVQLRFRRWLSHANYHSGIRIQARGNGDWVTVWDRLQPHTSGLPMAYPTTVDVAWTLELVDISAVVAGCAQAQVRFGIGPEAYGQFDYYGYMGWCIDDLEIVRTPLAPAMAADPVISSPGSYSSGWPSALPVMYPGNSHAFAVDIDNTAGPAITINAVEVAFINDIYVPAQFITPLHYEANNSWNDGGSATLNSSTAVAAGASGVVNGEIQFTGLPVGMTFTQITAHFFLRGTVTATGQSIELLTSTRVTPSSTAQPGLRVYEEDINTGPLISNGETAGGLRAFGSTAAGGPSAWLNIVLKNTSSTTLNLGLPTLAGQDPSQFGLFTTSMTLTLAAGQTTWFSVRFVPTAPGARTAVVLFTHDATNTGTPFEFGVSGLGIGNGPVLSVREDNASGNAISNGSAAAAGRDFGQVSTGGQSALTVYVENVGNQSMVLGSPMVSGPGAANFAIAGTLPATMAAGTSATFQVIFSPSAMGLHDASVEFTHNDPGQGSTFLFDVRGEGVGSTPVLVVHEGSFGGATIYAGALAGGARQFGSIDVGTGPSAETIIVIGNLGWQPLTLTLPGLSGVHAPDFVVDNGRISLLLQPGELTGFTVAFEPRAKGLKSALVSFSHNDPSVAQVFTFEVRGVGVDTNGVQIATAALPEARAEKEYASFALAAVLGTAPYTWDITQGGLPAGLTMDAAGTISGTPLEFGLFGLSLRVTDALGGDDQRYFELVVKPPVGHLDGGGESGSGCVTAKAGAGWQLLVLVALAAIGARRRKRCRGKSPLTV